MSRPGIAFLALRLAAIYCWIQALTTAASMLPFIIQAGQESASGKFPDSNAFVTSAVAGPTVLFATGVLLFIWAPVLANRMFPGPTSETQDGVPGMGGLALRLMGIFVGLSALQSIPAVVREWLIWNPDSGTLLLVVRIAGTIALAAVSAWLIVAGPTIARWLLRERTTSERDATSVRVQTIAFSIVGVWIFAEGLPQVVELLVKLGYRRLDTSYELPTSILGGRWWAEQWVSIARVVIGAGLFLGSSGLALLWRRAHTAGLSATAGRGTGPG